MMKYWQNINNIHLKALSVALPIMLIYYLFREFFLFFATNGLIFGSIAFVIYRIHGWIKYFTTQKNRIPEPKDPSWLAVENSNNKSQLPEFCILLKNIQPKFIEKYFYLYVACILMSFYLINQFFTGRLNVFDLKSLIIFTVILFLLKYWDKLIDEHNNRLKSSESPPNPYLQITHENIFYFDGRDTFIINWKDVQDIHWYYAHKLATPDIIIQSNNQAIHINGYYATIDLDDMYHIIYNYAFIIKNNRKKLKIT